MVTDIDGIRIKSMACAVPKQKLSLVEYAPDLFNEKSAKRMAKGTGFSYLRIADENTTTADLCVAAAEKFFLDIDRTSIGALVFVTQTPDYILPATSHVLQARLRLRNDVFCLDINEGCSGYVTGLYVSAMLAKQLNTRVCLLGGILSQNLLCLWIELQGVYLVMLGLPLLLKQVSRMCLFRL